MLMLPSPLLLCDSMVSDALDAGQRVLEHLRDARLDDGGGSARVADRDGHDGRIDGEAASRSVRPRVGNDADHDEQQAHHGRKDRAADREIGKDHATSLPPRRRMPARTRCARRHAA